jgi:7-alpha-hydroxysteroid dehydrogenase
MKALVTGGNRGIGLAIIRKILEREPKAQIWTVSRQPFPADPGRAQNVTWLQGDLSREAEADRIALKALDQIESLDLLVNNAGAVGTINDGGPFDEAAAIESFRLHCVAPAVLSRKLAPLLRSETARGAIVNIGSIYGHIPDPAIMYYGLGKAPMALLTSILARELAPDIRVNCILPGHIATAMTSSAPAEFLQSIVAATPLGKIGTPEQVADLVLFLASASADFLSGASVRIDGGFWNAAP